MRAIRVFADAALVEGTELSLDERGAHHVVRVLRRRTGDRIVLFDGRGMEAAAEIVSAHRKHGCRVRIDRASRVDLESPLRLELIQAVAKGDKLDLVIQKTTELGVTAIRPVFTRRTEVRPGDVDRRLARWREIAINACEQSGRTMLPEIHEPTDLEALTCDAACRVVLVPGAEDSLHEASAGDNIAVALGPEGGLDETDLGILEAKGFRPVHFGPRVLRTETAGIAAVAVLQSRFGDL